MPQMEHRPGVVVIGSDFRALGVVRSLGRRGISCIVVDNLPRSAWFSRYVQKRIRWHGPLDSRAFLNFLLNLARKHHLAQWVLLPMPDDAVELIARYHSELETCYQLVTQTWEVVQWANDKRLTYRLAHDLGIPCPQTWYPRSEEDLRQMAIRFPVIVKPAISLRLQQALRIKALPANNYAELLEQYRRAVSIMAPEDLLLQEIIPGDGRAQFSLAAYCKDGRILAKMTARRTRQYPIDYGLGSSFVEAVEVPALIEPAESLLHAMRVSGMLEVEFKYDQRDQQYKLLDINLRPWGWHTLAIACGLDFPWMQYCDLMGELPTPPTPCYTHHWVRFLTDLPAGFQEMRAGITTFSAYMHSHLGKTVFSVFAWSDPLPACGDLVSALVRAIHNYHTFQKQVPLPPSTTCNAQQHEEALSSNRSE